MRVTCGVWWWMLGFGMCGRVILGSWWSILSVCGFKFWIGTLCGYDFEGWCAVLCRSGGVSLCSSIRR